MANEVRGDKLRDMIIYLCSKCNLSCKHCLPDGTLILTDRGILEIEEVVSRFKKQESIKVLTHKGRWKKIKNILIHSYTGTLVSIKPYCLPPIKLTKGHRIIVSDVAYGEKRKIEIEKIDNTKCLWIPKPIICNPYQTKNFDIKSFIPNRLIVPIKFKKADLQKIIDLTKKGKTSFDIGNELGLAPSYVRTLRSRYKRGECERSIWLIESKTGLRYIGGKKTIPRFVDLEKLAKLFGYFCSEGSAYAIKKRPNSFSLTFSFGKHETEYIEEVVNLVKELFGITPRVYVEKTATHINIMNSVIARLFLTACGSNSHEKIIPKIILHSTNKIICSFLQGYLNGDGCFSESNGKKYIAFCSVSKKLVYGLITLMLRLGCHGSYSYKKEINGNINGRKIHGGPAYFVMLSQMEAIKLCNLIFKTKFRNYSQITDKANCKKWYETKDGWFVKIHKIKNEEYNGYVYNLTVADDESFVSPFIAISNCYLPQQNPPKELSLEDLEWIQKTFVIKNVNLMGGEPFLYPHLEEAVNMFKRVTITTNGLALASGNSQAADWIKLFRRKKAAKDNAISVQLSIEGDQVDTDNVRGDGVWNEVITTAKLLVKNDISCFFRCDCHGGNLQKIPWLIDEVCHPLNTPLILFPLIGVPPLTVEQQIWLFNLILEKNSKYNSENLVYQPHFMQWLRKPGRCGAGSERLCVTYDRDIIPCHFDFDYILGHIGMNLDVLNKNRELFLKAAKRIQPSCEFCNNADVCRSGCYKTESHAGCPLKQRFTLEAYADMHGVDVGSLSKQISGMRDLLKESLIC